MNCALQNLQIERGVEGVRRKNAQIDAFGGEQHRVGRGRIPASEKPQAGVAEQLDCRVKGCVAGDFQLDEFVAAVVLTLREIDCASAVGGTLDETGRDRYLVGPVSTPCGLARSSTTSGLRLAPPICG